jgi:hypothetical protein
VAVSWIQGRSIEQAGGTNISLAFNGQPVTPGNAIVVAAISFGSSFSAATCADNNSNTYTRDRTAGGSGAQGAFFSAPNATGGTMPTVTVTVSGANDKSISIAEFSGLVATAPADVGASGTTQSTPYATGTTPLIAQNDELVAILASHDDSGSTVPTASGYTIPSQNLQSGTVNMPILLGYNVVAVQATQSASIAWTTAGSATGAVAMIQTYLAAAEGPPPDPAEPLVVASPYRR